MFKGFHCCSKLCISLTQRYKSKLCTIVPKVDYFKSNILKLKTSIYFRNSKVKFNFSERGVNVYSYRKGGMSFRNNTEDLLQVKNLNSFVIFKCTFLISKSSALFRENNFLLDSFPKVKHEDVKCKKINKYCFDWNKIRKESIICIYA